MSACPTFTIPGKIFSASVIEIRIESLGNSPRRLSMAISETVHSPLAIHHHIPPSICHHLTPTNSSFIGHVSFHTCYESRFFILVIPAALQCRLARLHKPDGDQIG